MMLDWVLDCATPRVPEKRGAERSRATTNAYIEGARRGEACGRTAGGMNRSPSPFLLDFANVADPTGESASRSWKCQNFLQI